jgi:hypothetical protein
MRKTLLQVPIAVLTILCLAGAPASASKARAAEATYNFDMSQGGSIWVNDDNVAVTSAASIVTFETSRSDEMVELTVTDDAAATVAAAVWQEGGSSTIFCDTIASVPVSGGEPVFVQVILDVTPAPSVGCAAPEMPTTGTVAASFTGAAKKKVRRGGHHHH